MLNSNFANGLSRKGLSILLVVLATASTACIPGDDLKAKVTTTRMVNIGNMLAYEQPENPDISYLDDLVERDRGIDSRFDAWGYELEVVVEVESEEGRVYRIRSLGRDGKRGSCCQKFVSKDWDQDAVLRVEQGDSDWLQVW